MNVVWFAHSAELGGAERSLSEGATGLAQRGHRVTVILPAEGPLAQGLQAGGVQVVIARYAWWMSHPGHRYLRRRLRRLGRNVRAIPALTRIVRQIAPDLVVTQTITVPVGAVVARRLGIPHVWNIRELTGPHGHGVAADFGMRLSAFLIRRWSAGIIVPSQFAAAHYQPWLPGMIVRPIYSAIEPSAPANLSPPLANAFTIVQVGLLDPAKRPADGIQAVAQLAARGVPARLRLVGEDREGHADGLRHLARELRVADRLEIAGFTPNPTPYVLDADVALCARGDAFPRWPIEAMKLGKPVVGGDSGGITEQVRHGWNGFLYPVGNITELAGYLEKLHRDRPLLATLGRNAQGWATANFTVARHVDALLAVFTEALATHPAA